MQTLEQIEQAEAAARERAWSYGRLVDARTRLTKTIARLSVGESPDLNALQQVIALAEKVDPHVRTKKGFSVRSILISAAEDGIAETQQQAHNKADDLAAAERELTQVNAALAQFKE